MDMGSTRYLEAFGAELAAHPDVGWCRSLGSSRCTPGRWPKGEAHARPKFTPRDRVIHMREEPTTPGRLFTAMHELGHATHRRSLRRFEAEFTATTWALERFRALGIDPPPDRVRAYAAYVAREWARGEAIAGRLPATTRRHVRRDGIWIVREPRLRAERDRLVASYAENVLARWRAP
jgi:hypothetical protein